ncbi:MAG: phospholipid/cholesterol/gamma-HCH transport system substrate-binding protein [Pseudonocardiales bacterium]|nr:phospholipid/cholesterol/gamma-HCH transport system substrate-binding protein [Pseudonocardiales bacterium]
MNLRRSLIGSVVFVVVTALVGGVIVAALYGTPSGQNTYVAEFTDVSQLKPGQDVRAAGVAVGRVASVSLNPDHTARVVFSTATNVPMTAGTQVAVKYKNLIGDRYLSLTEGPGAAEPLAPGAIIPLANTHPALDLDELTNGFAPLLQGLAPDQFNQLSSSLIAVLQGEGGSIQDLLGSIGSLTGTLADRDEAIGQLIDNLNTVLGTLRSNGQQLQSLVDNLQTLVSGLAADRTRIGRSIQGIDDLTGSISDLLQDARPDIAGTVYQVNRLSTVLNADRPTLENDLSNLPGYYQVLGRVGAYSSAFQFYVCGVQLRLKSPTGQVVTTPMISSEVKRCQF